MERPNAWKKYDDAAVTELEQLCGDYRAFISKNKTPLFKKWILEE